MSNFVILNNQDHQKLRVITQCSAEFGDAQMAVSLTIGELREAQRDYPIVFHFDAASNQYYPMALLGFKQNENLFLQNSGWLQDCYIPAMLRKGPFKIGRQQRSNGEEELLISVDLEDARISEQEGELLFLPHGGNAEHTEQMAELLFRLNNERQPTDQFTQQLAAWDLLEPLALEVPLDSNGQGIKLSGFFIVNEEKLARLSPEKLSQWSENGFLQSAYFCVASVASFSRLVTMKQRDFSSHL